MNTYRQCPNCKTLIPVGTTCDCHDRLAATLREAEARRAHRDA